MSNKNVKDKNTEKTDSIERKRTKIDKKRIKTIEEKEQINDILDDIEDDSLYYLMKKSLVK